LTPKARVEFAQAASILFSPPSTPDDFALLKPPEVGLPHGFIHLRPDLAIGPFRKNLGDTDQFVMRASVQQYGDDLPKFVENLWGLDPLAQRYQSVLNRFGPLLGAQADFSPQEAMVARLLLVDDYRAAILRDPMLPRAALPPDWPGWTARRLFVHLYLQLSAATDSYIRQTLRNEDGLILDGTDQLTARMARLTAEAECQPA
jgi:phenylacetic acid degradation operon negative regulatory protein